MDNKNPSLKICSIIDYKLDYHYSEYVVRSACGWIFSDSNSFPQIKLEDGHWLLIFRQPISEEELSKLLTCLNDYRLREIIDGETNNLRQQILKSALVNVYKNLEEND